MELWPRLLPVQDGELLAQGKILGGELRPCLQRAANQLNQESEHQFSECFVFNLELELSPRILTGARRKFKLYRDDKFSGTYNERRSGTTVSQEKTTMKLWHRLFIIDEQLSPTVAAGLTKAGYKAKVFPKGTDDSEILDFARQNNAVVVTKNIRHFKNRGIATMEVSETLANTWCVPSLLAVILSVVRRDQYHEAHSIRSNIELEKEVSGVRVVVPGSGGRYS